MQPPFIWKSLGFTGIPLNPTVFSPGGRTWKSAIPIINNHTEMIKNSEVLSTWKLVGLIADAHQLSWVFILDCIFTMFVLLSVCWVFCCEGLTWNTCFGFDRSPSSNLQDQVRSYHSFRHSGFTVLITGPKSHFQPMTFKMSLIK